MTGSYELGVGIDWATRQHRVCVVNNAGDIVDERAVAHDLRAIHEFIDLLLQKVQGVPARIAAAIEMPRGALVETLLDQGLHVYAINPKQLDRFRDRHSPAGAKDDRLDAYVLADALRTDLHKFRQVALDHPLVTQIRELSRAGEDLREEHNRLINRLREQLYRCASHLLPLCSSADEPWFWDLTEHAVRPGGRRLTTGQVDRLLRKHRIRRLSPDDILHALRQEPLRCAPGGAQAAYMHIALLLPRLRIVHEQRTSCARRIRTLLDEYAAEDEEERRSAPSDLAIIRSNPGVGHMVAATLVAEADALISARDYKGIRSFAGLAPVTRQSGKSRIVHLYIMYQVYTFTGRARMRRERNECAAFAVRSIRGVG